MAKKAIVTPKGKVFYAWLFTPDYKYDEAGVYHMKLNFSKKEAAALVKEVDALMKESLAEAQVEYKEKYAAEKSEAKRKKMKKPEMADAPYMQEDDGTFTFTFKMKAKGKNRKTGEEFTQKPAVYDAKMVPLPAGTKVGNGSILKASYEPNNFVVAATGEAGVSLRLRAAQVLDLVAPGNGDGKYFGFEEEEGFSADDLPEPEDEEEDKDADDEDGEDGAEDEGEEEPVPAKKKGAKSAKKSKPKDGDEDDDF